MYLVFESILFVLTEGCSWRAIDRPQARWNSVYQYFRRWCQRGTLQFWFFGEFNGVEQRLRAEPYVPLKHQSGINGLLPTCGGSPWQTDHCDRLRDLAPQDRARIFGGTAIEVYRLAL